jgi:predicted O-methyltransferase YrrM
MRLGAARHSDEGFGTPYETRQPTQPDMRLLLASLQASAQEMIRMSATVSNAIAALANSPEITLSDVGRLARTLVPRWHFAMLNDVERNEALVTAVERQVRPGDYVLDIGAGSGLLSMLAAKAGAARVVSCEGNPLLAEIATQVIASHGLSDVVTVIPKPSSQLKIGTDLDRRADVIVAEIVDCGLIGEGILPTLRHARQHLLTPDGRLLPQSARVFGSLVMSEAVDALNRVSNVVGFNVGLINSVATVGHFPVRLHTWPHTLLSGSVELLSFNFAAGPLDDGIKKVCVEVTASGTAHGIAAWFEMDMGAQVTICNPPDNVGSHWMQAWIPFKVPIEVTKGTRVDVSLQWYGGRMSTGLFSDRVIYNSILEMAKQ